MNRSIKVGRSFTKYLKNSDRNRLWGELNAPRRLGCNRTRYQLLQKPMQLHFLINLGTLEEWNPDYRAHTCIHSDVLIRQFCWMDEGSTNTDGGSFYVDFERIRKHNGFVYYWVLVDFLAPTEGGQLSGKVYKQGDCKVFRHKFLSFVHHNQPMGRDTGKSNSPENPEWKYPPPGSMWEITQQAVCNRWVRPTKANCTYPKELLVFLWV